MNVTGCSAGPPCQKAADRVLLDGSAAIIPIATEIHHTNKRRGADLLDPQGWLAVSPEAHQRIEANKTGARGTGWRLDF